MDIEKLPKALKSKNIFCLWKYEQQENGKFINKSNLRS